MKKLWYAAAVGVICASLAGTAFSGERAQSGRAASPASALSPDTAAKKCKRGLRHAVIAGAHRCLKAGQRCARRSDRAYHRYGFHCHGARLTRRGTRAPSPPPPPPPLGLAVAATVRLGFAPGGIAADEGGVWVASWFQEAAGTVARIDPATNAIVARIPMPARGFTWVATGAGSVWVSVAEGGPEPTATDRHRVVRIDPRTNAVTATIDVGSAATRPAPLAVGEGGVWVSNFAESSVSRIDPATNRVTMRIVTTPEPQREDRGHPSGIAVTAGAVWVMNHRESTLLRIDPQTGAIVASIRTRDGRVAVGAGSVWVASAGQTAIDRVDPATNAVSATIVGCPQTQDVAARPNVVLVTAATQICRIDPATNRLVGFMRISPEASQPFGVTFSDDVTAWVSDVRGGSVARVQVTP